MDDERLIQEMADLIERLRTIHAATHGGVRLRHGAWLALWDRGYGLSEIAQVSGHSRERVRMVLMQMGAQMPRRAEEAW